MYIYINIYVYMYFESRSVKAFYLQLRHRHLELVQDLLSDDDGIVIVSQKLLSDLFVDREKQIITCHFGNDNTFSI